MAAVLHADDCGGVTAPSDKPLSQRMTRHALAILHLLNAESITVTAVASGSFTSDGTFSAKKLLMHKIQKLVLGIIHLLNEGPAQLDVSVSITEEDLLYLETEQRALYRDLMTDNEQTLRSAGAFNVKTEAAPRADKPERHMREPQDMRHNESVTDMIMSTYTNTTHRSNKPERQMREPQGTSVTDMIMSAYTDTTHRSNKPERHMREPQDMRHNESVTDMIMSTYADTTHRSNKPERHMREPQDTRHNESVTDIIMSTYTDTTHRSNKPERQMREPQGTSVTNMIMSAYTDTTHRSNKPGAGSSSFEDYPSTFSEDKKNSYSSTFLDPATKPLPQCSNNESTINSYQLPSTNTCTENSPNTFEKVFTDSCKDSSFMSTYSSAFTETCPIIPTSTCQSTLLSSITDTYQNTCPDDLPVIQIKQEGSQMELNSWHWTVEDCVTSQNSSAGEAQPFGRKPGKSARKSPTCKTLTKENDEVLGPMTVSAESLHPEHRTKNLMSSENNRRCSSKTDSRPLHRKLSWKKPYECLRCDKSFKCRSHLVMHQRVHTRERPYVCTECGKSFTQSSNLFRHQRGHRGERPHACTECGKTFTHSSYLLIHIRTHTGEKPYSCRVCGSCFRVKSALVRHERVHMAEKR